MKDTGRPLFKRTEAFKAIRKPANADTEDNCYFRSCFPEEDSGTSGSEVSPFGSFQIANIKGRPRSSKSEVPGTPAVEDVKYISWRRNMRTPPFWLDSTGPEIGKFVLGRSERRQSLSAPVPVQLPLSHPADPPRPPKDGMEWVWFPEGYWAERERKEIDRKSSQANPIRTWFNNVPKSQFVKPFREDSCDECQTKTIIPRGKSASLNTKKGYSKKSSRRQSEKRITGVNKIKYQKRASLSSQGDQSEGKEGLYYRTKRNIEARLFGKQHFVVQVSDDEVKGSPSLTTTLLEGTTESLKRLYHEQRDRDQKRQQPSESQLSTSSYHRRYRGLAPWHHRQSHESLLSVTSSIHKILMGRTPIGTPLSEKSSGSRSKNYISNLDPSDPKGDTFLPSEARRITTPRMSQSPAYTPGFVYGASPMLSPALENVERVQSNVLFGAVTGSSRTPSVARSSPSREISASSKRSKAGSMRTERSSPLSNSFKFEINVPEHFPTSPLCPKNPKHKSGGRGVCVYHGRAEGRGRGTQSEK